MYNSFSLNRVRYSFLSRGVASARDVLFWCVMFLLEEEIVVIIGIGVCVGWVWVVKEYVFIVWVFFFFYRAYFVRFVVFVFGRRYFGERVYLRVSCFFGVYFCFV